MQILLCLLSDQHIPNIIAAHHFKPDRIVLIETPKMKANKAVEHFIAALKNGGLDYSEQHAVVELDREDDFHVIRACMQKAFSRFPAEEWICVLTGGNKPMSICAYEFFKVLGQRLIYTNVSKPEELIDVETGKVERCEHKTSAEEFLAGYGFSMKKAKDKISEAEKRAEKWWNCSRLIAEKGFYTLLKLSEEERKQARNRGLALSGDHWNTAIDRSSRETIATAFELDALTMSGGIDKYGGQFLTGGWLEVFIWGLLSRHGADLEINDVRLGQEVVAADVATTNDLDVSFMHRHAFEIVECKSGDQQHDQAGDVLYKLEAVIRQFRALRVKSYLVITGSNILDCNGVIKESIQNRASLYNCRLISVNDIKCLAAQDVQPELIKKLFFAK